jgi:hypothetical protein
MAQEHTTHAQGATTVGAGMAGAATLHCLSGCAIGEILGLLVGMAVGLSNGATLALAVALAFVFGYLLSTLPLLAAGAAVGTAFRLVLAADTLSIATMELVDNAVMALIPGAMDAGLVGPVFWIAMPVALAVAFAAAYPVNRALLQRRRGHALTHQHGHVVARDSAMGWRRFIPTLRTGALVAVIAAFLLGGLVVALAAQQEARAPADAGEATHASAA